MQQQHRQPGQTSDKESRSSTTRTPVRIKPVRKLGLPSDSTRNSAVQTNWTVVEGWTVGAITLDKQIQILPPGLVSSPASVIENERVRKETIPMSKPLTACATSSDAAFVFDEFESQTQAGVKKFGLIKNQLEDFFDSVMPVNLVARTDELDREIAWAAEANERQGELDELFQMIRTEIV